MPPVPEQRRYEAQIDRSVLDDKDRGHEPPDFHPIPMEPLRFVADKGVRMGKLCLRHASIQVTKMSQKVSRKEGIGKPGTPLAARPPVDIFELVRLIAVTRIALPRARVRLAAGRTRLSREGQALCFFAGANSIFYGDKLLTAKNPAADVDVALLRDLGLQHQGVTTS